MEQNIGPEIADRLAVFADAVRARGLEPVAFHVGAYQWQQLRDWAVNNSHRTCKAVHQLHVEGLPVWRHDVKHHMEVETICSADVSHYESCL